jgi:hypothetical protein
MNALSEKRHAGTCALNQAFAPAQVAIVRRPKRLKCLRCAGVTGKTDG